jgi:hypothetical protein
MGAQDDLFELIKSLNKSEKGYFKKYNSFHVKGEENSYMKVFNEIDKMAEYEEDKLKKKFAGTNLGKNFAVIKNYLYKQILRSLEAYHTNELSEIRSLLNRADILLNKNLRKQSLKQVRKAKELSLKKERFSMAIEAAMFEQIFSSRGKTYEEKRDNVYTAKQEVDRLIAILNNVVEMDFKRAKIVALSAKLTTTRDPEDFKMLEELIKKPILSSESNALSNLARAKYHSVYATYYYHKKEYQKSLEATKQVIDIMQEHPEVFKEDVLYNSVVYYNYCFVCLYMDNFIEARRVLNIMRDIDARFQFQRDQLFQLGWNIEFNIYLNSCDFDEALKATERFVSLKKQQDIKMSGIFDLITRYQVASIYFVNKEYGEALTWVNSIINSHLLKAREDFACWTRMLDLVVHFELHNYDLLEYKIKSAKNFIEKKGKIYQVEELFFSYMNKLIHQENSEEQKKIFARFKTDLEQALTDPNEERATENFDFLAWIESKLLNKPLATVLCHKKQKELV